MMRVTLLLAPLLLACGIDSLIASDGATTADASLRDVTVQDRVLDSRVSDGTDARGQRDVSARDVGPRIDGATVSDAGRDGASDAGMIDRGCPPDPSLLVCLMFDGNLNDSSGRGFDALRDGDSEWSAGRRDQAIRIRPGMRVTLPNHDVFHNSPVTIEAWIYIENLPGRRERMGILDKDNLSSLFIIEDAVVRATGTVELLSAEDTVREGRWYHLAATLSEGNLTELYVDGARLRSGRGASNEPRPLRAWRIGHNDDVDFGEEDAFDGSIDSIRIWSRVLSEMEILRAAEGT